MGDEMAEQMESLGVLTVVAAPKDLLNEFISDPPIDYQSEICGIISFIQNNSHLSPTKLDILVALVSDIFEKRRWRCIIDEPPRVLPQNESEAIQDVEQEGEGTKCEAAPSPELLSTRELLEKLCIYLTNEISEPPDNLPLFSLQLAHSIISLLLEQGSQDESLELCMKHLHSEPLSVLATKHAAIMFKKIGDWKQSLGMYQRLLALTADPLIHCRIGDIYYAQQSFKKAFHHYKTAVELNPRDDYSHGRLENARKFYVARLVRKRLKIEKFDDLPMDYMPLVPQSEWVHPAASPALTEFFELWKNERSPALNLMPLNSFNASDTTITRKKKRATMAYIKRSIGKEKNPEEDEILPRDTPQAVNVQTFQFTQSTEEISQEAVRKSGNQVAIRFIASADPAEDVKSCSAFCCGQRVSLYPWLPGHSSREGGPVTDCFGLAYYPNLAIVALADGSSWGHTARQAATKAVTGFIQELEKNRTRINNTKQIPQLLLDGLASAHNNIIFVDSSISGEQEVGTSTLLGGVLLPFKEQLGKWIFMCASVGDCKAFHLSVRTHQVIEITAGNDRFKDNRDDPGGAIGAIDMSQIQPDLRNLRLFTQLCEDGDIIIMVSDGVHDNFNPKYLGIAPRELKLNADNWVDVIEEDGHRAVSPFIQHSIENKIHQSGIVPTPHRCTHALLNNSLETTQKSRDFMEQNPTKKLPDDYSVFPGQLDYASCLSFTVGMISSRQTTSAVNLWDYHLGIEESSSERDKTKCAHPYSENTPISVAIGESADGIVIVCRTIAASILRCIADETQVYLKLYRKGSAVLKMKKLTKGFTPVDDHVESEQPVERTIHLPGPIEPSTQQITRDQVSGLTIIRFSHKKPN